MSRGLLAWLLSSLSLLSLSLSSAAPAGELESLQVRRDGRVYRVDCAWTVAADAAPVMAVLGDHERLTRLSRIVIRSEPAPGPPGKTLRALTFRPCVLFFCVEFDVIEEFRRPRPDLIVTRFIPERSEVKSGSSRWRARQLRPGHTRIEMRAEMEPDFWAPPFIGPLLIKMRMRQEAAEIIANIERAAAEASRP